MKLFERLRWLPTEIPWPGTADVSAKSCVLAVLVGETPGTSSARSRKFRPFIGRLSTSVCATVPAICVRAVSSAAVSAATVTLALNSPTASTIGNSNAEPTLSVSVRVASANPCRRTVIS